TRFSRDWSSDVCSSDLMTIRKSGRFTTTEGVLLLGLALSAVLFLPALLHYENYTVSIFYRWWTIHLWVEGVWEMIQGGFLAYLLIRLRSEEHTSELQSRENLVCRLLLEK